jgi:DNA-binding transcriptional ArsR family regulator
MCFVRAIVHQMVYLPRVNKKRMLRTRSRPEASGAGRVRVARAAATAEANLDEVFFALSHVARRRLLARLGELGDQAVRPLSRPLPESAAQITKHLAILERAGLISRRIEGREHRLHLEPRGIAPALDWIARHKQFWGASLDRLEQFLDSAGEGEP